MRKLILASFVISALLSGCTTTSVANARTEVSSFDGSKRVSVSPHGSACINGYMTCAMLGFTWSDKYPNQAGVLVQIMESAKGGDYHAIATTKLNIDGDIVTLKPSLGDRNHFDYDNVFKTTSRLYDVPLSMLERVQSSTNTKIQVIAEGAVIEGDLKNSADSTKAYYAMLGFLEQVKATKK